eukprot:TRINITY_DN7788_c0_g1_i2.p2 TRINITY_DN7788_c0_g1~~TRINITY_DN7788_c0_g1_i2.p2  ORF type:complete len:304 (+),score=84.01 TRINITY_DN7788_c0_g1_i2:1166-2077(+)
MYCSMHNYELDSLCYHMTLSYEWWKASGRTDIFSKEWLRTIWIILNLITVEQNHDTSPYVYIELPNGGRGKRVAPTGMSWTGFRPSDDQTELGYLIPSNIHAVVALEGIAEIARTIYKSSTLEAAATKLRDEIDKGIHEHGVINHSTHGKIYAYEVDGLGNSNLMDDANVPSLLSVPYFNFHSQHDPLGEIAQNTRKFVWSKDNRYYFEGSQAKGIGSIHTGSGTVWHMSIIMRGLTTDDPAEVEEAVATILRTDANTGFVHESFNPSNPSSFSRTWFAWANSLFSELILMHLDILKNPPSST